MVAHHADEDGWDEEHFFQFVVLDRLQHGFHREGGEHVNVGVEQDGEMQLVDEACDVEER